MLPHHFSLARTSKGTRCRVPSASRLSFFVFCRSLSFSTFTSVNPIVSLINCTRSCGPSKLVFGLLILTLYPSIHREIPLTTNFNHAFDTGAPSCRAVRTVRVCRASTKISKHCGERRSTVSRASGKNPLTIAFLPVEPSTFPPDRYSISNLLNEQSQTHLIEASSRQ